MKIEFDDIRTALDIILRELESGGQTSFELDKSLYWKLDSEDRYDVYRPPENLAIGDLYDDWAMTLNVIKHEAIPIKYNLVWLAEIIRALGESNY